jgi:hypothetical protein
MRFNAPCLLVFLAILSSGCSRPQTPKEASNSPPLKAIDLRYGVYLARIEIHTTVSPDGHVHRLRTDNKSYHPNDNPGRAKIEVRDGRLTPDQMTELARLFSGWESLDAEYNGVVDGPDIEFTYGEKRIHGGSLPKKAAQAMERVEELAQSMPAVGAPPGQ